MNLTSSLSLPFSNPIKWYFGKVAHLHDRMADLVGGHEIFSIDFVLTIILAMSYMISPIIIIWIAIKVFKMLDSSFEKASKETKEWIGGVVAHILTVGITCFAFLVHFYFFLPTILLIYIVTIGFVFKNKEKKDRMSHLICELGLCVLIVGMITLLTMSLGSVIVDLIAALSNTADRY
ncbi:hypothetical protein [Priestia megaterium]|uniref:hypothetical protein n=1 Tax=Priestia megaterium TaxID=1404 RepID=UPI002E1CDD30|nr:hypothetical protein [Priestia megaterium]